MFLAFRAGHGRRAALTLHWISAIGLTLGRQWVIIVDLFLVVISPSCLFTFPIPSPTPSRFLSLIPAPVSLYLLFLLSIVYFSFHSFFCHPLFISQFRKKKKKMLPLFGFSFISQSPAPYSHDCYLFNTHPCYWIHQSFHIEVNETVIQNAIVSLDGEICSDASSALVGCHFHKVSALFSKRWRIKKKIAEIRSSIHSAISWPIVILYLDGVDDWEQESIEEAYDSLADEDAALLAWLARGIC